MSIFEYDKELEEKKIRKAEYEFGYSEGHANGIVEGIEKGAVWETIPVTFL